MRQIAAAAIYDRRISLHHATSDALDAKEEATVILISPYNRVINWILNGTDFLRRRNLEIEARI